MKDRTYLERVLLGKLINEPNNYFNNHSFLNADLFKDTSLRELYIAVDKRYTKHGTMDLVEIMSDLKEDMLSLVHECCNSSFELMECRSLVLALSQETKKEQLKMLCLKLVQKVDRDDDLFDILDEARIQLDGINNIHSNELIPINEQLHQMMKKIEENAGSEGITGIPSGYYTIDKFTSGWQKQDLIIVGGASSMGKTSLAMNMAVNASKFKVPTVIFSYEMSVNQLLTRLVSSETLIDNKHILKGKLFPDEFTKINKTIAKIENLPLHIDECNNTSLNYLLNRIRQYVISKNIKLVVVDYLQLISNTIKGRSREQEVSQVARALKNIAKEHDIVIMALSQLSRGVNKRDGSRPTLADLRESGEIEQAADTVMLVYRPEYYNIMEDDIGNSTKGLAEIIFAKGRNIGIGSRNLKFIDYITKFEEPSYEQNNVN